MEKNEDLTYVIRADDSQFKKNLNSLKSIAKGAAKAIGAGMMNAGQTIVEIGKSSINSAIDMDKALNQFSATTGKSTEETERYKTVMEDIYTSNYGDSFGDIGQAMTEVTKSLGNLDDSSLKNVTESAFALRDTFGYGIPESTRAAKTMMDNFGVSGDEAMGMIAAGAQNGLDYSGELMDGISKYSAQFSKVGLDADDMFNIFQKGAETGAWNVSSIGNAVGEMSLRVLDGSETTREGFETIGLNADDMAAKFAAGGDSAKGAFQQTIEALAQMEDPLAQNTAGVDLFGSMWEELGPEAVTQLAGIQEGAYNAADAMGQIKDVKCDDLGSMFESLKKSVEVMLIPIGEMLIPILKELINQILPVIEESLPPLIELVTGVIAQLIPLIEEIMPVLVELFQSLLPPLMEILEAVLPPLIEVVSVLLSVLQLVIDLLMPLIELIIALLEPILKVIAEGIMPLLEALQPLIDIIGKVLTPIVEGLKIVFSDVFNGILDTVKGGIEAIIKFFSKIINFLSDVFTGQWGKVWDGIVSVFKRIFNVIPSVVESVINGAIGIINGIIGGINDITGIIGIPSIPDIPQVNIPRLKVGMDYIPSDFYPAYLDAGEAVLTKQENAMYRDLGGLQGMYAAQSANGNMSQTELTESLKDALRDAGGSDDTPDVHVYVGNKEFKSYIVDTAHDGINKKMSVRR